jgi:hypothetical protein
MFTSLNDAQLAHWTAPEEKRKSAAFQALAPPAGHQVKEGEK